MKWNTVLRDSRGPVYEFVCISFRTENLNPSPKPNFAFRFPSSTTVLYYDSSVETHFHVLYLHLCHNLSLLVALAGNS